MGFESSQMARRRLAALAASNSSIREALAPSGFPGFDVSSDPPAANGQSNGQSAIAEIPHPSTPTTAGTLARQLEELAQEIVATPGAGGALLAAYACQARALTMVMEATRRSDSAWLPEAVMEAVTEALATPFPTPNLMAG